MPVLAAEGNWLLDGPRRQVVLLEVPLIPRLIVLYGFGPGYRRQCGSAGRVLERVYALVLPEHRDRTAGPAADLRRLGEVAVGPPSREISRR